MRRREGFGVQCRNGTEKSSRRQTPRLAPVASCQSFVTLHFFLANSARGSCGGRDWGPGFFQGWPFSPVHVVEIQGGVFLHAI